MTIEPGRRRRLRAPWTLLRRLVALSVVASLASGVTWAYWTAGSVPGGNGASAVATVNQGATPTSTVAGRAVTVTWAATTLSTGQAVSGYTVKRYSGLTVQSLQAACTGTIADTSCVESNVPLGTWTYSVTPMFATNWVGTESAKSSAVDVVNVAPAAVADSYSVGEDATLTVPVSGVLANDTDADADALTAILVSGVASGALTFNPTGAFTYVPGPDFNGSDSFTYKANDGPHDSSVVTVMLTTTAGNDAPVNSVPGAQQTPKNTNRVFSTANNNLISIRDSDAGGTTVQVQLNATNGTVTLPVLTNLTFSVGDGTSDTTMTFSGTITNINLRLAGVTFIPTSNFTGAATLQIITSDLGNTGSSGPLTDTDSVTVNVNALGIFTANQDIGGPGVAGSSTYSAGSYTVAGGGGNIWNNADQFQYLYRALTGDGRLTAKVVSELPAGTNAQAKAGVMFRESTAAGSKHAIAAIQQTVGSEFLHRLTTDGASGINSGTSGPVAPYWLRITRVGDSITAQRSTDGVIWTNEGTAQTVSMNASINLGLAVTAHDNAKLLTATYDNVAITTRPTAVADNYVTNEDTTLNVTAPGVLWNDTDPESNALTAVLVSGTAGLTLNADGSFAYVPPANVSGAASFTYKTNDGLFDSNTVTVNLTVNPANEVPSFTKGANQSAPPSIAQTVAGWATGISQGAGESGQLVNFTATNDNDALFSVQPTVSPSGTLTYTPTGATGVATVSVSIRDNGGTANGGVDTSAIQTFTITIAADVTGPSGGSVDASGLVGTGSRYATSTSLSLNLSKGTDPSGLAASGAQLTRATGTLTGGVCGTFGPYSLVSDGTDPATPKSDTVTDQACFSYRYLVADTPGNPTTYTSPDIKVDLIAPAAPTLDFSAFTNTWWSTGSTVYYRSAATSGSFTATASATDASSGIGSYGFPAFGTNWTSTPGALGVHTYSWSGAPAAPGTKNVTATDNAGSTSASSPIVMTVDDTAPTAGTVSYVDGDTMGTSVTVTFAAGTDSGSGIGTRLLQRASATRTNGVCGTFGGFTTVTNGTNPTSPLVDTVVKGNCYKYQYAVADNVGNTQTTSSTRVAYSAFGAYYAFDAGTGTTALDSSGNAHTGTLQAGAGWTTGNVGPYALNLTGATNSFVDVASPVIDTSASYSVSGWFKLNTVTGNQTIASIDGTAVSPFYLQVRNGGAIEFLALTVDSTATGFVFLNGGTAVAGSWYHVVGVHDNAANTTALYVNGVLMGSTTFTSPWTASGHTVIGRAKWNGASVDFVNGAIDDVRFYDTVLNQTAVTALYGLGTDYSTTVQGTSGLVNYWRLGEATTSSDSFTGSTGAELSTRSGEIGATWTLWQSPTPRGLITNEGRLRRNNVAGGAGYYSSAIPASPDYLVEADIHVKSVAATDDIGINGRILLSDTDAIGTNYLLRYHKDATLAQWELRKNVAGVGTALAVFPQTLTPGSTYRVGLDMNGTTIRMLVDGVERGSVSDSAISGAGRAGVRLGASSSNAAQSDTQGMHLDNFRITPPLADSKGTNHGDYLNGPTLGNAGAIAGDANTATLFDGVNDHGRVARQISNDFSIEFWFKSTQSFYNDWGNPHCTFWWQGAGLIDADVPGSGNDFGISLCDGKVIAGVGGTPDVNVVTSGTYINGAWHHVVFTRTQSSGALALYVDGAAAGTATGTVNTLNSQPTLFFGQQSGGIQRYAGSMDEIAVYSTVVSAATVAAHYDAGL